MSKGETKAKMIYLAKRNPTIAAEDWPRVWRSHPKFVAQFPTIGGNIDRLRYCARVLDPTMDGKAVQPAGATTEYDGAAVFTGQSFEAMTGRLSDEDMDKIWDDERRVFSALTPTFAFHCEESFIHGQDAPTDVAVLRFVARKPGTSHGDFAAEWNGPHASRAIAAVDAAGIKRYVQNLLVREAPGAFKFDGISESWFDSVDDAVKHFDIAAPEGDFTDPSESVTMLSYIAFSFPRA